MGKSSWTCNGCWFRDTDGAVYAMGDCRAVMCSSYQASLSSCLVSLQGQFTLINGSSGFSWRGQRIQIRDSISDGVGECIAYLQVQGCPLRFSHSGLSLSVSSSAKASKYMICRAVYCRPLPYGSSGGSVWSIPSWRDSATGTSWT